MPLPLSDEVERFNKSIRRNQNAQINVKTATRESAEQFKTDKFQRYCVIDDNERLDFIPALFTPTADNMIASWLRQHSDYDGGFWNYWIIPQGVGGNVAPNKIIFTTTQTGYIAPAGEQRYNMCILGNYFESEVSADAAGIIATLMIMNWLSRQAADMGLNMRKSVNILSPVRMP